MKNEPVLIKSNKKWDINRPLFTQLLALANEINYDYLPRTINKNVSYDFKYDLFFECSINTDRVKDCNTLSDMIKIIIDEYEPFEYFIQSVSDQLYALKKLVLSHYKLYINRTTTERLNYKLFNV